MMRAISRNFGSHAPKIPPYHLPTPIMQGRPSQNRVRPQLVVLYVLPLDATQYTSVNVSAVYSGSRGDFSRAASGTGRAAFPLATPFYNTTTVTTSTGDGTCSQRSVAVRFQPSMGDRIFLGWQVTGLTSRRDTDPWTLATRDNRRTSLLWRMGGGGIPSDHGGRLLLSGRSTIFTPRSGSIPSGLRVRPADDIPQSCQSPWPMRGRIGRPNPLENGDGSI